MEYLELSSNGILDHVMEWTVWKCLSMERCKFSLNEVLGSVKEWNAGKCLIKECEMIS